MSHFPRVVWQKDGARVVQTDRETLAVEVSHPDAMGAENWKPAMPDAANDAIAQALREKLNEDEQ